MASTHGVGGSSIILGRYGQSGAPSRSLKPCVHKSSLLNVVRVGCDHIPCRLQRPLSSTWWSQSESSNTCTLGSYGRVPSGMSYNRQPVTALVRTAERGSSSPPISTKGPTSSLLDLVPERKLEELTIDLPLYDPLKSQHLDLLVVGAGPAGLAVAQQVSAAGLQVCCVDPTPKSIWPNNYGVWVDEFEAMGLGDCLDYVWPQATVHLDEARKKSLDRPYGRVNRVRLKTKMIMKCVENGVQFYQAKVASVSHNATGSEVRCTDGGPSISATVVLDATGFSRRLVEYSEPYDPGYQAAWGILAEVESHPFELDRMLFMDWRDSHLEGQPELHEGNTTLPTFLYAMPFSKTRIFVEETSLVARPSVDFGVIQQRLEARLHHLGIKVLSIEEEEYCLIPMGGVLPSIPQRVLGIGGTAGMVHPSTGYMVARTLAAAPQLADAIVKGLRQRRPSPPHSTSSDSLPSSSSSPLHSGPSGSPSHSSQHLGSPMEETSPLPSSSSPASPSSISSQFAPSAALSPSSSTVTRGVTSTSGADSATADELSAFVWREVWPIERLEQREFFWFGMEVLLKLDLNGTRRFFDAFFDLSPFHWQGFLSSRLYLSELIVFGLSLFSHATNAARFEIVSVGTPKLGVLLWNVLRLRLKGR
eukprot:TRINITY_DN23241_c0_g1_i1.p1 TRINITY_DN23241_c0_g1~~TRINITY_DN23241_c0_g1_i1.p1  ORF type:complete len:646 (-),score=84.05 TRINITY_DN23241_c0_g1_i1:738-2675(-)